MFVPYSKLKAAIAEILVSSGYLGGVSVEDDNGFKHLKLALGSSKKPEGLIRVSKPGRRIYAKSDEIPSVKTGRGLVIVSTPSGIMTGKEAKSKGIGGELICKVY